TSPSALQCRVSAQVRRRGMRGIGVFPGLGDTPVERSGFRIGCETQFTLKRVGANPELPQRGILSSLREIKPHQLAMRILIRRIESEEPQCRDDGRFGAVTRDLMIEQESVAPNRQFMEPATLRREPFLERLRLEIEAVQQITVTELDGFQ